MADWDHDHVLNSLQNLPAPIGSLVRAFPGKRAPADESWLEKWFVALARDFSKGRGPDAKKIMASAVGNADLSLLSTPPVQEHVRIRSIRTSYFRGFRAPGSTVNLDADLVVIEGRNSSGKTSVSEAIEWAITGHLSRRDSGQHGHASELANCIANEFRPEGGETFVELELRVANAQRVFRRVLRQDYSRVAADAPISDLFLDGRKLTITEAAETLNSLFAGIHPILMQHNLRRFVHDEPHARRQYFERLLQIDELTALIEKAVVGSSRVKQIANPDGGVGLASLRALVAELERAHGGAELSARLSKLEKLSPENLPGQLEKGLLAIAAKYFGKETSGVANLAQVRDKLHESQRSERELRLPLLASLTAARSHQVFRWELIAERLRLVEAQAEKLQVLTNAAASLTAAQQQIAQAAGTLSSHKLLELSSTANQLCPLCEDARLTLSPKRVSDLSSWWPLASAITDAQGVLNTLKAGVSENLSALRQSLSAAIPNLPARKDVERQLKGANQRVASLASDALATAEMLASGRMTVGQVLDALEKVLAQRGLTAAIITGVATNAAAALAPLSGALAQHREVVAELEEAVGTASRDDARYRLRDRWLELAGLTAALSEDTAWESAKQSAKVALDSIREGLIALRTRLIEHARNEFSDEMSDVWHLLRSDSGAQFNRIVVPEARGKGYKLEFALKAVISDGTVDPEVDALRVFSESQVNAVGLAAYITRARSLGHRILIFDDPVQSMDEEHFRSFAGKLLPSLLDEGFQVVILTHSDTFARRLNEAHFGRDSYVTLECRSGRKIGCQVDEGNRRVSERLKRAEKKASQGELQEAWRLVRLAIERLYTLAYLVIMPSFNPETWANMPAEDMWNQGAGDVITRAIPGSGAKLKSILAMTVAGAHDKAATSETDVRDAIKYIKTLLGPLKVGAG